MLTGMGWPAATPGQNPPIGPHTSTAGGWMPAVGMACGLVGAFSTHPSAPASAARLLHNGCTANLVPLYMVTLARPVQAHLSPFSLVWLSFHPSCTEVKLSGSVTASAYS